jgi:hypothetical protein
VLSDWAWIGGLLGVVSVGAVAYLAHGVGRLKEAMVRTEEALRQRLLDEMRSQRQTDLKLELFVRSAEAAEIGTRTLLTWSQILTEHATSVVFDKEGEQGFRQTQEQLDQQRFRAEQAGLFLPPELDRPYQKALKAVVALEVAADSASHKPERADRKELCRPAVVAMDQEMLTFLNTVRVWKKRQWFHFTTGEEAAPDSFADVTSPSLTRPRRLVSDENGNR